MRYKQILLSAAVMATLMVGSLHAQAARHTLEGSWISATPGLPPTVATFTADGSLIETRPPVVLPPSGLELVATGHGNWSQKGSNEILTTVLFLRSSTTVEFTGITRVSSSLTLNETSDVITGTATIYVFDATGTLLVSFPISVRMTRIPVEP